MAFIADWADMPDYHRHDSGFDETHPFFHCPHVRPFWDHIGELTNSIDPKHIVSIDLCYICDNVLHPLPGMKQMVFLMLLTVVGMVVWTTRES